MRGFSILVRAAGIEPASAAWKAAIIAAIRRSRGEILPYIDTQ